jgi:hypothetical protein
MKNPQNNLKICSHGKHIFGLNILDRRSLLRACSFIPTSPSESGQENNADQSDNTFLPTPIDNLTRIVSEILCAESALQRLRHVQSLDVLDVEGISKVFDLFCDHHASETRSQSHTAEDELLLSPAGPLRVGELKCTASEASLESLQSQPRCPSESASVNGEQCLNIIARSLETPLFVEYDRGERREERPSDVTANCLMRKLSRELSDVDDASAHFGCDDECTCILHRLRKYQVNENTSDEDLADKRAACLCEINSLQSSECLYLLKLWLICLAASDASLVVTLEENNNHDFEQSSVSSGGHQHPAVTAPRGRTSADSDMTMHDHSISTNCVVTICNLQSDSQLGCVSVWCPLTESAKHFTYKVTFLDLGPKPAGKIVHKIRSEKELCRQANSINAKMD